LKVNINKAAVREITFSYYERRGGAAAGAGI
jgi:hypothetical protein